MSRKCLTQHPLLWQDPASLWSPATVPPYADTCLPHSFADCSSTELDQLHQTLSGRLGMLGHKHGWLALEQVLLVLPGRQVPLETTHLRGETDSWILDKLTPVREVQSGRRSWFNLALLFKQNTRTTNSSICLLKGSTEKTTFQNKLVITCSHFPEVLKE